MSVLRGFTNSKSYAGTVSNLGDQRSVSSELKFHDKAVGFPVSFISQEGTKYTFGLVTQGTTSTTRVGRQIHVTNINIRGIVSSPQNSVSSEPGGGVRLMVFVDKQTNGAIYSVDDLFEDSTQNQNSWAERDVSRSKRFEVLYDQFLAVCPNQPMRTSADVVQTPVICQSINLDFDVNIPLEFDSSTGAIADCPVNSLQIVAFVARSTEVTYYVFNARVRFYDC